MAIISGYEPSTGSLGSRFAADTGLPLLQYSEPWSFMNDYASARYRSSGVRIVGASRLVVVNKTT
jgi:hypothetical protein